MDAKGCGKVFGFIIFFPIIIWYFLLVFLVRHWRIVGWFLVFVYIYPLLLALVLAGLIVYGTALGILSALLTLISSTYRNWFVHKPGYIQTLSKFPGMKSSNPLITSCTTVLYSLPFAFLLFLLILTINTSKFYDIRSILTISSIGLIPIVGWFTLGWQLPLPKGKRLSQESTPPQIATYSSAPQPVDSRSYTETLSDGGTLHVNRDTWSISYMFPGPDRRYNPTFYHIEGHKVEALINALIEGWAEGERLQAIAPENGSLSKTGSEDIRISASSKHVSVYLPNMRISAHSREDLEKLTAIYQYARNRAKEWSQHLSRV